MGGSAAKPFHYSVEVEAAKSEDTTGIRRHPDSSKELIATLPGYELESAWDVFELGLSKGPDNPCLGTRVRDEKGQLGGYQWMSYAQTKEMALKVGTGLRLLDLTPIVDFPEEAAFQKLRLLGIFAKNRAEWIVCEQACNAFNIALCPLYDTLGPDAIVFIVSQTKMTTVVAGAEGVDRLLEAAQKEEASSLKTVIVLDPITADMTAKAEAAKVQLLAFDDVVEKGKDYTMPPKEERPKRTDVNTICYTSGTTGDPKGVIMTHWNFVSLVCASIRGPLSSPNIEVTTADCAISYLPLAHVYERIFNNVFFAIGASLGYYGGDTQKLVDDIRALRPTVFCSVPRLFYRINDKVVAGLADKSAMAQFLFTRGLNTKLSNVEHSGTTVHHFWDRLVFNKTRALLGGRVRYMISGSAPLDPTVSNRMKSLFCIPLLEGYGLTESLGASFLSDPVDPLAGTIGGPFPCVEFRLISVPEMDYVVTSDPPAGELLMRGPSITPGYFRNAQETASAIDADGWLHTGDVAMLLPSGAVKIIDRRKNLFKLAQGEYLAPEKIENIYLQAPLVAQVFVFGYSEKNFAVGIVVPDEVMAKRWAAENKLGDKKLPDLCSDEAFKKAVDKEMREVGKHCGLRGFEYVKDFHLTSEPFTIENNLLTPTMKLRRHDAKRVYQQQIDGLYEKLEAAS